MRLNLTNCQMASRASMHLMRPLALAGLLLLPLDSPAAPPGWWATEAVLDRHPANDFANANQGQAKHLTVAAIRAMDLYLGPLGGAGPQLHTLASRLRTEPTAQTDDYAPVTIGQLKMLVSPIYDRLLKIGYYGTPLASGTYPWVNSNLPANDFALANIGQLKNLFSFDFSYTLMSAGR